jgi:hypothetical protein
MLKINKEITSLPKSSYVNGWFKGKLFEFTYFYASKTYQFGTEPPIGERCEKCDPLPEGEQVELIKMWLDLRRLILTVPFVSVWDGGTEIITEADVDARSGEITNIKQVDVSGLELCERQYIVMNDEQVDVYEDEHGCAYWADIEGVYDVMSIEESKTQCVNGELKVGDIVLSTPSDDYACLIGRVIEINLVGSPEHDDVTENETDAVHVNFLEFDYSKKRKKEIETMFSQLYSQPKTFDDCPIDYAIMSPDCLIRITGIDDRRLSFLLDSECAAARYCYDQLFDVKVSAAKTNVDARADHTSSDSEDLTDGNEIIRHLIDIIDSAVALAGYRVIGGDSANIFVRHSASDTDFCINIEEEPA